MLSSHEEKLVDNARQFNDIFRTPECRASEKSITGSIGPVKRKLKFRASRLDDEFLVGGGSTESLLFHLLILDENKEAGDDLIKLKPFTPVQTCHVFSIVASLISMGL